LSNRFDNRVERTATVRSTGCQTGLYNQFDNRVEHTIQPVVKPVVKRLWQPGKVWQPGKCLYTRHNRLSNQLSKRLSNRFNNRLYRVYKHSASCQSRLTTGLTTGCIVCSTRLSNWLYNPVWQPDWQLVGCLFTRYNGTPLFPSKLPFLMGRSGPHLIYGSLGQPEFSSRTASRSIQPFFQGSLLWQTARPTDRLSYSVCNNSPHLRTYYCDAA